MNSKDIKANFKKLGLTVSVRTIPSARPNPWIEARLRPTIEGGVVKFARSFDEPLRRKALAIVYGAEFALKQSAGGNIGSYSISLHETEWTKLFDPAVTFPLGESPVH